MRASLTPTTLLIGFFFLECLVFSAGCQDPPTQVITPKFDESIVGHSGKDAETKYIGRSIRLFDGKSLDGWETIGFGGEGSCSIENEILTFEAGDPFTGIRWTSENLPKTNFEVSLEARRTNGIDFFCGLTFPVAQSHCTLIVGAWAGATVGLSCIEGKDAASNDTTKLMKFETDQWYRIRVRVDTKKISAWIDDEHVVDQNIASKQVSLRGDTELCRPLGICSFMTAAEFKNIYLRNLEPVMNPAAEIEASSEK